jgi:small subunit ribosomal protein S6
MARERDYQLGIVLSPDLGEDQVRTVVDRINNLVAANGGRVFRVLAWGRRRLAYPIEHHRDGLYYWFDMQLPPDSVVEVERTLHVTESIMRHLLTLRDADIVAQERIRAEEAEARAAAQPVEAVGAGGEVPVGEAETPEVAAEPAEEPAEFAEAEEPMEAGEAGAIEEEAEV